MAEVVLLAGPSDSSRIVAHALEKSFGPIEVIEERKNSVFRLLSRRVKRLGPLSVMGQVLFKLLVIPLLRRQSQGRRRRLLEASGFTTSPLPRVHRVTSVNSSEARELLRELSPKVVVINGTRILEKLTLECVNAPFINMHMGITPAYRGCHGGYWALVEGRADLVGTTVHRVDQGIDTGVVLGRAFFNTEATDNFTTYPCLHLAAGIPVLLECVGRELSNLPHPPVSPVETRSELRHHPTLWGYLRAGVP